MYVSMYVWTNLCMYVNMYVWKHVCKYVCKKNVCMCVCIKKFMYVCM